MSKNDPAERAVHGLGRHPHGLSERLQVVERGVGQAEGVHQHDRPQRPVPLCLIDG